MLIDIPRLKVKVDKTFLTGGVEQGFAWGYLFAVTLLESRPLLFTVHMEDGAVFSRLPIQAFRHEVFETVESDLLETHFRDLDPWGAISGSGNVVEHAYLKDYHVVVLFKDLWVDGKYAFTIDYDQGGFAQDPEQHKTSNIILLDDGHLCAMPNNFCRFIDKHFATEQLKTPYKRQTKYHLIGE